MYASQTKRLCVREATSDEARAQDHSNSSNEATTETVQPQQIQSTSSPASTPSHSSNDIQQYLAISRNNPQATSRATTNTLCSDSPPNTEPFGRRPSISALNMTASASENAAGEPNDENQSPIRTSLTTASNGPMVNRQSDLKSVSIDKIESRDYSGYSSHDSEHQLIHRLSTETREEAKLDLILSIRNLITACNKKKESLIKDSNFKKVLHMIDVNDESSSVVKAQFALLLCSLAKGGQDNIRILCSYQVDEKILNLILETHDQDLVEACLRCFRVLMSSGWWSPVWLPYVKPIQKSSATSRLDVTEKFIDYAKKSNSYIVQECISDIFSITCVHNKSQMLLLKCEALACISEFVCSKSDRVVVSAIKWLSSICNENEKVSLEVLKTTCPNGKLLLNRLIELMSKDSCYEMQFLSAKCFAQIYGALAYKHMGDDPRIISHVLPTLVRMVQPDKPPRLRARAAECISHLIKCDTKLQETASICDHLIESLASMLDQESAYNLKGHSYQQMGSSNNNYSIDSDSTSNTMGSSLRQLTSTQILDLRSSSLLDKTDNMKTDFEECDQEMRQAAFLALAALASTLEPIRKKIFDTCAIMQHLVRSLQDSDPETLKSVLTCLLSLSRSVQQLRINFAENSVYSALKSLLSTKSQDILVLVLAILCNISLDFSPGKQQFLDSVTIKTLCSLTKGTDPYLRLHGMWILMNMVYQLKDQNLKFQILKTLDPNHVVDILKTENHEELIMKTLGFLRNLLSQQSHIDAIMSSHGKKIMDSLVKVLERPCSARIKEQALCVLTNIADGSNAKALIMNNRSLLSYLTRTMCDDQAGDMRLAAICCITNLAQKEQEGSYERRDEMRKLGIEDKLKSMLNTNDPILSDRVRTAFNQFFMGVDDKCVT